MSDKLIDVQFTEEHLQQIRYVLKDYTYHCSQDEAVATEPIIEYILKVIAAIPKNIMDYEESIN